MKIKISDFIKRMLWTLSLLTLVCWYCNTLLRMLILLSTESNNHDCFPSNLPPDQTWNELTFEMLCAKKRWSTWSWKMTSSFSSSLIVGIRFKVQFFVPLCKCWNTQINSVSASLCWNIQRGPSLSMVLKLSDPDFCHCYVLCGPTHGVHGVIICT